jgi:hypothetical protein
MIVGVMALERFEAVQLSSSSATAIPTVHLEEPTCSMVSRQDLELADFDLLERGMDLDQVCSRVGWPHRDICSGRYCPEYDLVDGCRVMLAFAGAAGLLGATVWDKDGTVVVQELLPE